MKAIMDIKKRLLRQGVDNKKRKANRRMQQCPLWLAAGSNEKTTDEWLSGKFGKVIHHVALAQIVSKYIGETEKNLQALFEAAAAKDFILVFDEADALFGKRTQIRDAHDRYANRKRMYILQLLETYPGIVVLATGNKCIKECRHLHTVVRLPAA